jgi:putative colanic acid biosynthesis acetyltransferase WcaF
VIALGEMFGSQPLVAVEPTTLPDRTAPPPVRNDLFDKSQFDRGRSRSVEAAWYITKVVFFLSAWPWPASLKSSLLRLFGCDVGRGLVIRPRVNIHFPWKLKIGEHCWIGEGTEILNLASVTLEDHSTLSHGVYIAAAGHDSSSASMAYKNRPIHIGRSAWVTSRAFVGPGVTVGEGALIGAGAVVLRDVEPLSVMVGNPAVAVAIRRIQNP